jgi:hypothetical protein
MFCAPGIIFGCTESVGFCFHVLRGRTHFRRYRGRWLPFSSFRRYRGRRVSFLSFARLDSFPAVLRASVSVFMSCAAGLVFGITEGVDSRFQVLRSLTHFRRYRGRRVPFSCIAGQVSGGTEGVGFHFHVLRARTNFRRYRGRRVLFLCLACPDSFPTVPRESSPVFKFCAPVPIFGGIKVADSPF